MKACEKGYNDIVKVLLTREDIDKEAVDEVTLAVSCGIMMCCI